MTEQKTPSKPTVTKRGNVVTMPVETYDGLITRLLVAESDAAALRAKSERSWFRP